MFLLDASSCRPHRPHCLFVCSSKCPSTPFKAGEEDDIELAVIVYSVCVCVCVSWYECMCVGGRGGLFMYMLMCVGGHVDLRASV